MYTDPFPRQIQTQIGHLPHFSSIPCGITSFSSVSSPWIIAYLIKDMDAIQSFLTVPNLNNQAWLFYISLISLKSYSFPKPYLKLLSWIRMNDPLADPGCPHCLLKNLTWKAGKTVGRSHPKKKLSSLNHSYLELQFYRHRRPHLEVASYVWFITNKDQNHLSELLLPYEDLIVAS